MKKILVVLLVFAVAGGVFAQLGEWSLSGGVQLNTQLDAEPNGRPTIGASDYGDGVFGDGDMGNKGFLDAAYKAGPIELGLNFEIVAKNRDWKGAFDPRAWDQGGLAAYLAFEEEDSYAFKAKTQALNFIYGPSADRGKVWFDAAVAAYKADVAAGGPLGLTDPDPDDYNLMSGVPLSELWGWYKFIGGVVHLEAAYKGPDVKWWLSDDTAGDGWAKTDGANYLLTNVSIGGLQIGMIIPRVFILSDAARLVNEALLESLIGFKFTMEPIEFAGQIKFKDFGIYFGATWQVLEPIKLGLSFQTDDINTGKMAAGAKVEGDLGQFGAALKFKYSTLKADHDDGKTVGIEPSFWYKVLPDYLLFRTELGFYFDKKVSWAIAPQLTWNFLGDGAKSIGDIKTGFGVKYVIDNNNTTDTHVNSFYAGFKWGF